MNVIMDAGAMLYVSVVLSRQVFPLRFSSTNQTKNKTTFIVVVLVGIKGDNMRIQDYEIKIQPVDYGFIVRVGCKTMVFETKTNLTKYLKEYLADPEKIAKKIFGKDVFNDTDNVRVVDHEYARDNVPRAQAPMSEIRRHDIT
jgi:hypothetical protein